MKVGSLFSGAGGFDMGFEQAGFRLAWQAEIEPHACAVLRHHWPDVPNLGDVRDVGGALLEPVDVVIGGFPCQDLSVAGKRAGLEGGARSSLFFQFMRIVEELRSAHGSPAFVVIENVPGLFSSNGGRDFAVLLARLAELGAVDIAWRVLDAQHFGVPQRRRRVFLVVDLDGERAEQVLFEREGVPRDSEAGEEAGEGVAGTLGGGSGSRGWASDTERMTFVPESAPCLTVRYGAQSGQDIDQEGAFVTHSLRADGFDAGEDGTGRGTPLVPVVFDTTQITSVANYSNPKPGDPCHPLAAGMHPPAVALRTAQTSANGHGIAVDEAHTLDGANGQAVAFDWQSGGDARGLDPKDTAQLQRCQVPATMTATFVRRLTPTECERLMGWPDDHTRYGIKHNGTRYELADGPRYKLCGNGVVAPVARWIAERLAPARGEEGK